MQMPSDDFCWQVLLLARKAEFEVYYSWLEWCKDTCASGLGITVSRLTRGVYEFSKRTSKRYDIRYQCLPLSLLITDSSIALSVSSSLIGPASYQSPDH